MSDGDAPVVVVDDVTLSPKDENKPPGVDVTYRPAPSPNGSDDEMGAGTGGPAHDGGGDPARLTSQARLEAHLAVAREKRRSRVASVSSPRYGSLGPDSPRFDSAPNRSRAQTTDSGGGVGGGADGGDGNEFDPELNPNVLSALDMYNKRDRRSKAMSIADVRNLMINPDLNGDPEDVSVVMKDPNMVDNDELEMAESSQLNSVRMGGCVLSFVGFVLVVVGLTTLNKGVIDDDNIGSWFMFGLGLAMLLGGIGSIAYVFRCFTTPVVEDTYETMDAEDDDENEWTKT